MCPGFALGDLLFHLMLISPPYTKLDWVIAWYMLEIRAIWMWRRCLALPPAGQTRSHWQPNHAPQLHSVDCVSTQKTHIVYIHKILQSDVVTTFLQSYRATSNLGLSWFCLLQGCLTREKPLVFGSPLCVYLCICQRKLLQTLWNHSEWRKLNFIGYFDLHWDGSI